MRKNTSLEIITAITFLVFVGIYFYYSFYPFKVTTLNSITIDKDTYCRGEWVQVGLNFTKHMDVQAEIKWYIVDGIVYELESPGVNRKIGDNDLHISKQIPHSILPGSYNLRVEATYQIHSLRKPVVNTWNTPTFKVLDASECPDNPDQNLSFPDPLNKPDVVHEVVRPTVTITEPEPQVFVPDKPRNLMQDLMNTLFKPFN